MVTGYQCDRQIVELGKSGSLEEDPSHRSWGFYSSVSKSIFPQGLPSVLNIYFHVAFKLFQNTLFFHEVLGTCGNIYLFAERLRVPGFGAVFLTANWASRSNLRSVSLVLDCCASLYPHRLSDLNITAFSGSGSPFPTKHAQCLLRCD